MVNTGKPSQGCYMCRARRIKCDEAKPNCMRCQKSKRICPGYRDAFELNLRDETKSTKKKISRLFNHRSFLEGVSQLQSPFDLVNPSPTTIFTPMTATNLESYNSHIPSAQTWQFSKGHLSSSSSSSVSSLGSFANGLTGHLDQRANHSPYLAYHPGCIFTHLTVPADQQAACFFLSNFVVVPQPGTLRGYLSFILPFLGSEQMSPAVKSAFSAVSLAAFGARPNSKSLLPKADTSYYTALKEINATLKNPRMATDDSTLAAILMLSTFEQIMAPRKSHEGWASHIDGAIALLKARGPESFQKPEGQETWNTVRALMVVQRITRSKHVDVSEEYWMSVPAKDECSNAFARLNIRVANLRGDYSEIAAHPSRTAADYDAVFDLLQRAKALEQDYANWFDTLEGPWAVTPVNWIDYPISDLQNSLIHPGRVDAYTEMWMAYHHNIGRSSRLITWTTILRCVAWLCNPEDYRLTEEYATATQVCRGLIEDIVASVPYIFGWNKQNDEHMADRSSFACGTTDSPNVKSLWAIFVMWPIFSAANSDFALPSERTFLRGRLKYVNENLGIHQASVLLHMPVQFPSSLIQLERHQLAVYTHRMKKTEETVVSQTEQSNWPAS
ncbi:Zn2/Cys6 DNA-binding protein [Glarea lozoyensis ATCC 20868]|uniref:Zn2/Cys6 DNA-binding protein n=1 Tax=Glarea lozoyensis (strain ATCC 20868 / MF5171) TaxID=1116229 RepID=S3DJU7_GLAL2|nr:Zn2/Cys6 DNA-binding protein [Glarea lozoyensis ATCC 20868]EPE32306.1 Zn2/Cys6 DNA-binding protein [Glarea lozoyensis ATCC 20868]